MAKKQAEKDGKSVSVDTKAGSRAYNRFEMQVSQTLHMAIELYSDLNYLLVLDHYDDITLFDDDVFPETVSYYQMKTSEDSISIDTAISEAWIAKLYEQLSDPVWMVKELGLITNCPLKVSVKVKGDDGEPHSEEKKYMAERTPFLSFNPIMVDKLKADIAKRKGISVDEVVVETREINQHIKEISKELRNLPNREEVEEKYIECVRLNIMTLDAWDPAYDGTIRLLKPIKAQGTLENKIILAQFVALFQTMEYFKTGATRFSFVVDSPRAKEASIASSKDILKMIAQMKMLPQIILATIDYSEYESEIEAPANVIVLTEKRKLLNSNDFAKNQEYIISMTELLKNYQ